MCYITDFNISNRQDRNNRFDRKSRNKQANLSILGVGGGLSGGSISKAKHIGREKLQPLLLDFCSKNKQGLLVTIDEIQKVSLEDVSSICNAFQMASRKGYDIMFAAPERGKVMFCIPYLADYVKQEAVNSSVISVARQRGV